MSDEPELGRISSQKRPLGVTLIGILWLVRGVLSVVTGALTVAAVAVASIIELAPTLEPLVRITEQFAGLSGIFTVFVGVLQLLLASGLLHGRYLAWLVTLVLEVVRAVVSVLTLPRAPFLDLLQILISAITIAYLLQPRVKAFFKRKLPPPP